jgi:hypothetical protein
MPGALSFREVGEQSEFAQSKSQATPLFGVLMLPVHAALFVDMRHTHLQINATVWPR